jgi:hypothetical protein
MERADWCKRVSNRPKALRVTEPELTTTLSQPIASILGRCDTQLVAKPSGQVLRGGEAA